MSNNRKPDLLSYEIQAQALREQAIADMSRAATQAVVRAAVALGEWFKPRRPAAPATLPL